MNLSFELAAVFVAAVSGALAGGVVLLALDAAGMPGRVGVVVITVLITGIRLLAIRYSLNQSSD